MKGNVGGRKIKKITRCDSRVKKKKSLCKYLENERHEIFKLYYLRSCQLSSYAASLMKESHEALVE
jgi:hypothetical protein